jgi:hypothetical protein
MNVVERTATRSRVDRRDRSKMLCDAADAAIRNDDLELAQRLLIQADVDDLCNLYPERRLERLDLKIERLAATKLRPKLFGRNFKFVFLYASTLRGPFD